jgi:PAS domain S-box-containing protein
VLENVNPYLFFWLALFVTSWYGGQGPTLLVTALSALSVQYFFLVPTFSFRIADSGDFISFGVFVLGGSVIAAISGRFFRAQERIRRMEGAERQLAAIVESSHDAIIGLTLDGTITSWNAGATELYGYTAQEMIGHTVRTLVPPNVPDDASEILNRVRHEQRVDRYETKRRTKDGRVLEVELTVSPIRSANGAIIGAAKIARDVTEHNRILAEQRRQRELLEKIIENAPIGIAVMTWPDLRYMLANTTIRQSLGMDDVEFIGRTVAEVFPAEMVAKNQWIFDRVHSTGRAVSLREYPMVVRPGEKERWRNTDVIPLMGPDGRIEAVLTLSHDITDVVEGRKRIERLAVQAEERAREAELARRAAEEASRAKDEFLATVSHELRTPLTTILAWAAMLRSQTLSDERRAHALTVLERNAKSLAQLIEDLLDVSRIIAGKMRLDVRAVDLAPVIEAAIESLRPAADAKHLRLQAVLDPRGGIISGDPERLQQVVWNLLSNAIKFTPKGGRVQVHLARVNSHVELSVSDTGSGIPPDVLPYIFDRFRQADSSTRRVHGGLGLGLAIVRHLVELHGGNITVESVGEGKGTTFTVSLPLMIAPRMEHESRRHPSAGGTAPPGYAQLDGVRVLCVDDDVDTCEMLTQLLESCGAEVRTATNVSDAFRVLQEWRPDVLISDVGMPEQDGYMLIQKLRALAPSQGGRIPAIAMTAYARVEDRVKTLSAGFQMHMPKPIEPVELVMMVAKLAEGAAEQRL